MQLPVGGLLDGALFVFVAVLVGLAYVGVGWWLYGDARARGSDRPLAWVANWALFTAAALAYYLLVRDRIGERTVPVTRIQQAGLVLATALVLSFGVGTAITPPDPYSQMRVLPPLLLVALPAAYALLVALDLVRTEPDR